MDWNFYCKRRFSVTIVVVLLVVLLSADPTEAQNGLSDGLSGVLNSINTFIREVLVSLFGGEDSDDDEGSNSTTSTTTTTSSTTSTTTVVPTTTDESGAQESLGARGTTKLNHPDCGYNSMAAAGNDDDDGEDDKVVNGRDARPHETPWQLMLIIHAGDKKYLCGASLIAPNWAMTAAHCVTEERHGALNADAVEVYAGLHNRSNAAAPPAVMLYADCILVHPEWRGRERHLENDLALLHLAGEGFTTSRRGPINTVCLPEAMYEYLGGVRVSGWGLTRDRNTGGKPAQILQIAGVNTITDTECRRRGLNVADSMLCQDSRGRSPCNGDSGGPLAVYDDRREKPPATVLGIVSFGPAVCANAAMPHAVYTQVSFYLSYLEESLSTYQSCSSGGSGGGRYQLNIPTHQVLSGSALPGPEYFAQVIPRRLSFEDFNDSQTF